MAATPSTAVENPVLVNSQDGKKGLTWNKISRPGGGDEAAPSAVHRAHLLLAGRDQGVVDVHGAGTAVRLLEQALFQQMSVQTPQGVQVAARTMPPQPVPQGVRRRQTIVRIQPVVRQLANVRQTPPPACSRWGRLARTFAGA